MSLFARIECNLTVRETGAQAPALSPLSDLIFDQFNLAVSLNDGGSPPIHKHSELAIILSPSGTIGVATIDLRDLDAFGGTDSTDFNGCKLVGMLLNNVGNDEMIVSRGITNGYGQGSGNFDWSVTIPAGGAIVHFFNNGNLPVTNTRKTIDIVGEADDELRVVLVAGF